jgi:hypothetical protein
VCPQPTPASRVDIPMRHQNGNYHCHPPCTIAGEEGRSSLTALINGLSPQTCNAPHQAGQGNQRCGPRFGCRVYDDASREALIVVWEASDRFCGIRLRPLVPILVEAMER